MESVTVEPVNVVLPVLVLCTLPRVRVPLADTIVSPVPTFLTLAVRNPGDVILTVPLPVAVTIEARPESTATEILPPATVTSVTFVLTKVTSPLVSTLSFLAVTDPLTAVNTEPVLDDTVMLLATITLLPLVLRLVTPFSFATVRLPVM